MAIDTKNVAIDELKFNIQTKNNIKNLYKQVDTKVFFGRNDVSEICGI